MKPIIATFAGSLLATAAFGAAWAGEAPRAAPSVVATAPAVSPEITNSVPEPAAEKALAEGSEGHSPAEAAKDEAKPEGEEAKPAENAEGGAAPEGEHATEGEHPAEGEHAAEGAHEDHAQAPPPVRAPMPFDVIRTLQFLQDQVARGNGRAIRVQSMVLRKFSPTFLAAGTDVWADQRNRRAAILFTLSGGPPELLRQLIAAKVFDDSMLPMAEGALAYVQNDLKGAAKILAKIDLVGEEPGLAAHMHLVVGQLLQNDLPAVAVAHLDQARLLAPGGLIEEASLRLEVVLVDKLGDHDRADGLARQYFDRFTKSAYADNFLARFAMVYDGRGETDPKAALDKVYDIGRRLDDTDRRALLLALSRRALVAGHLEFAQLTGSEALKIHGMEEADQQRANLYTAAAGLASMDPLKVATELQSVDRASLHPADAGLLDAANTVLANMEGPPIDDTSIKAAEASSPTLDRAQKLLDAVAGDLGDKTK